ncbi:MAG TPA: LexA family transcriptional regulator [Smithellaceae bacterium]|nr:LexA family transcriptional regulator [Smithellaceae bacterium]
MEKTRNIEAAMLPLPYFDAGAGYLRSDVKVVEFLSGWGGKPPDPTVETPAQNLVARAFDVAPKDPFPVPALVRVVGLAINGEVCAGFPSPAEEELRDNISFDEYLVAHPETSFLLSVTGDSMTGAGIMEKDLVIVERGRQPKNGDIILAEVDGNWTMKYFRKKGSRITLEAANPKYPPIVPQTELRIAGVVTGLVRKYHR